MKLKRTWVFFAVLCLYLIFASTTVLALSGTGTENDPYLIGSYADWRSYCNKLNGVTATSDNVYAKLTANIDLTTKPVRYTKNMKGTLDGNGYKITGVNSPLYSDIYYATIKNLVIEGANITDTDSDGAGAIARTSSGTLTVENCYLSGSISGEYSVGAFVGVSVGTSTIRNCITDAQIVTTTGSLANSAGGIIGNISDTVSIENCIAMGNVSVENGFAGGLVGGCENHATLTITNSVALEESVSGKAGQSGKVFGGTYYNVTINGTNVYTYLGMTCSDDSFENTQNSKYHGTNTLTRTACRTASFWNTLFEDNTNWTVVNGELPKLKTTLGAIITDGELPEYLLQSLTIDETAVTVENADNGNLLIVASYNGNTLVDIGFLTLTADTTEDISDLITIGAESTICAMLWDGLDNMIPLCEKVSADTASTPAVANLTDVAVITYDTLTGEAEVYVNTIW